MQAQRTTCNTQQNHVQRASQSAMHARSILNMSATRNAVSGRGDSGGERCARACKCVCARGFACGIASASGGPLVHRLERVRIDGGMQGPLNQLHSAIPLRRCQLGLFPLARCKPFPLSYFDYGARLLQVPKDVQQQHDAGAQHGACCEQHRHVCRDHYTLRRPVAEASLVLVHMWHGVSPILVQMWNGVSPVPVQMWQG